MKNVLFLALTMTLLVFSSCTKDDNCTAPALETNIVGTWTYVGQSTTFEFKSDGTLEDPSGEIIDIEINGVNYSEKTYSVNAAGDMITVTAKEPNGTGTSSADLTVTDNQCDKITFEIFGAPVVIERQ